MDLSVLIPTRGRPGKLAACVASLPSQRGTEFEVLVGIDGDDGVSEAAANEAWNRSGGREGRLRILDCPRRGPAATRNALMEAARGRLLLLLNDDVEAGPGLLAAHAAAHAAPRVQMVLGAAPWRVHEPDRLFDRLIRETSMVFFYDQMAGPRADDPSHDWGFRHAWTLNLSVPASAMRAIGGFDPSLPGACFEDLEMAWRLRRKFDAPVVYRAGAAVIHDHRYEPRGYLEREFRLGHDALLLARASPACARDVFGRDVASVDEIAYSRVFVDRERSAAARVLPGFEALAGMPPASGRDPDSLRHDRTLVRAAYEAHLPLKRWMWRAGLLRAVDGGPLEQVAWPA